MYDYILMIIPIGFIIALLPMIRNKSKFVMSKSTIVLEIGLLALEGVVFLAMDLTISSILTFVNAGAWFLVWHRNETQIN